MSYPQMAPMGGGRQPVLILNPSAKRDSGRRAQLSNINAGKAIASIVRSTLGPKAMLKMLLDPMGGIVLTNDGHAILREIDVTHPGAKTMMELSRSQDEEVGDGTTSVMILAGEMLSAAEPLLDPSRKIHPTKIVAGYMKALEDINKFLPEIAENIDPNDQDQLLRTVRASIDTKFANRWGSMISELALKAAQVVKIDRPGSQPEIDLKRYAKVEKIPGGDLSMCRVLDGVMLNKDVTNGRMRRFIRNPRIVLLDCTLEYKKGESETSVEVTKEADWAALLRQEEEEVQKICDHILAVKPDLVITEKGVSDLAQHFLMKQNVSVIRRVKKTDNNRIARICGATIATRAEELTEAHVGTGCGTFKVQKVGDEWYTFLVDCKEPKACSVVLRGGSKDVLNEIERNLQDAFCVARNILIDPRLLPGGGAAEMALAARLNEQSKLVEGVTQFPYKAVASALEVIPRTLAANCGIDVVRVLTDLRSRHSKGEYWWGIDGNTGEVVDVRKEGIVDSYLVKQQTFKASIENAGMILRIDDIVSGISHHDKAGAAAAAAAGDEEPNETFGDSRDG
ncbi:T-complex protein 1 subunit gamma [Perkinsus olseni]|uniref:T-complex protein 1 subunit gamma n=1 Tax=Perkinsus olseni TaxID=32597 RepID=A0A7J6M1L3_PEROL|nr:T-complex protein 1 subunit gamma [Perkinsus olseni]